MTTIQPHGGVLVNAYDPNEPYEHLQKEIPLDGIAISDLELIGVGAYSPIDGFLSEEDYKSVVENMRLANGIVWSIPITLPVTEELASTLKVGDKAKLVFDGEVYGIIEIQDIYKPDKTVEAKNVYGTDDLNHPGVKKLFDRPNVYVGGKIILAKRTKKQFPDYTYDPVETRELFEKKAGKR